MSLRFVRWLSLVLCTGCVLGWAAKKPRIGIVAIQDRKGHALVSSPLDGRLLSLLKNAGFEAAPLRFQPAADVEYQAREAGCTYILYSDVVDVHKTTGTQVVNAVSASRKRDIWDAEVEFRIFAVDQVQPLLATSVTRRNAKSRPQKGASVTPVPTPAPTPAPATLSVSESNVLTEATPMEETGRQRKHKSVAVASALDREVKLVRDRLHQQTLVSVGP
jgi:hypothetical protein